MILEAFLSFLRKSSELNPHTHAGVARADYRAGRKVILFDPEIDAQGRSHSERHDSFHITTIPADVCCIDAQRCVDAFIAEFKWKGNLVASEAAAVVLRLRSALVRLHIARQDGRPRAFLVRYQLHANLRLLQRASVHHPDNFAARLLAFVLHTDDIADLQFGFNSVDACTSAAYILRHRILE